MDENEPTAVCDRAREIMSADIDGETDATTWARQHIAECAACAEWTERAAKLDRLLRINQVTDHQPDELADTILSQVRLPRRGRWRAAVRAALLVVAAAQFVLGVISLFHPVGMTMPMPTLAHIDHEEAAFNIAFGIALATVAWSRRAGGQIPVLTTFVVVLAVSSAVDLADGAVTWPRLATHLPIVAGLLLAVALGRMPDNAPGRPLTRVFARHRTTHRHSADNTPSALTRTTSTSQTPPAAHREVA